MKIKFVCYGSAQLWKNKKYSQDYNIPYLLDFTSNQIENGLNNTKDILLKSKIDGGQYVDTNSTDLNRNDTLGNKNSTDEHLKSKSKGDSNL